MLNTNPRLGETYNSSKQVSITINQHQEQQLLHITQGKENERHFWRQRQHQNASCRVAKLLSGQDGTVETLIQCFGIRILSGHYSGTILVSVVAPCESLVPSLLAGDFSSYTMQGVYSSVFGDIRWLKWYFCHVGVLHNTRFFSIYISRYTMRKQCKYRHKKELPIALQRNACLTFLALLFLNQMFLIIPN